MPLTYISEKGCPKNYGVEMKMEIFTEGNSFFSILQGILTSWFHILQGILTLWFSVVHRHISDN